MARIAGDRPIHRKPVASTPPRPKRPPAASAPPTKASRPRPSRPSPSHRAAARAAHHASGTYLAFRLQQQFAIADGESTQAPNDPAVAAARDRYRAWSDPDRLREHLEQ